MADYAAHSATGECSEPLWAALKAAAAPASIDELHGASRAHPQAIRTRLRRWAQCGFVTIEEGLPPRYQIAADAAHLVEPPYPGEIAGAAWSALRRIGRPATFDELLAATGAADRALYCRLWRWAEQGFLRVLPAEPRRFSLTQSAPDAPVPPKVNDRGQVLPPRRSARSRIWKVMRVLKTFDVPTLMIAAEVKRRACDDFLNLLVRAGYVRMNGYNFKRLGSGAVRDWSTYTLLRNTGPRHPTISAYRGKAEPQRLTDHNTGASVELAFHVPRQRRGGNHDC
jgi:hypothetical protein